MGVILGAAPGTGRTMKTPVHIEGMGWLGSVIAWHLERAGIGFTWQDNNAAHVAWRACTGIVYPAGDERSVADYNAWLEWQRRPWWPVRPMGGRAELCAYWFNHRNPPHEGKYRIVKDLVWARMGALPAVQVNVPEIVARTQYHFSGARRTAEPKGRHVLIRAHGFGPRLGGYMWGWSTPVELSYPSALAAASDLRPTFYSRQGRFKMAYAYAVPGSPELWLAGSSLITQRTAKPLDARKHFSGWLRTFAETMPGIEVVNAGEPVQGWRPKPAPGDDGKVHLGRGARGPVISVPPLWHSGVRWAPSVVQQTMEALERCQ